MPLEIVFLEPQNWRPLKTLLLNPYYRLHGKIEGVNLHPLRRMDL